MRRNEDSEDFEPLQPTWCPECNALVKPKYLDFGIGPWEIGSQKGWHHDWVIGCPDCECLTLVEPPVEDDESTECRWCGEIEPCDDRGMCASCQRRAMWAEMRRDR